jgi:hypothetical protein
MEMLLAVVVAVVVIGQGVLVVLMEMTEVLQFLQLVKAEAEAAELAVMLVTRQPRVLAVWEVQVLLTIIELVLM